MKILVIVFCLMSTKSVFGVNGRGSPESWTYVRRRIPPFSPYARESFDEGLVFLKNFLDSDCFKSIYAQKCQPEVKFPRKGGQERPLMTKFKSMSTFGDNRIHPIIRNMVTANGLGKKYFVNPKIIIVPSLVNAMGTIKRNFQNQKELIRSKKLSPNLRPFPGNRKEMKTGNTEKGESFRKEEGHTENEKNPDTKISRLKENRTTTFDSAKVPETFLQAIPIKSSSVTNPKTTPALFGFLRPSPTQTYEVEEIIEDTINVDDHIFTNAEENERTYFENDSKSVSSDNGEQVVDDSIMTIIKEMTESGVNLAPTKSALDTVSREAESEAQTTAPTKFQNFLKVLHDGMKVIMNGTKPFQAAKEGPSRGMIQKSDRFPEKKEDNEQGALKPTNSIYQNLNVPSLVTTKVATTAASNEGRKEANEAFPHTFFEFFTTKPLQSMRRKPGAVSKNLDLNSLTYNLSSPVEMPPDENPQPLLNNSIEDESKLESVETKPPSSTERSISSIFTTSPHIDNETSNPFTPAQDFLTFSIPDHVNQIIAQVNTEAPKIPPLFTVFNKILLNPDLTTENFEGYSDNPLFVNLLTTQNELKKDSESYGKNSRKIHFNQDIQDDVDFNRITENFDQQPRRSDILITEDYKDNEERLSTLTSLGRIKPNGTIIPDNFLTNATMDSYIPLIPEILSGIRENEIPPQDLSLLSSVFGKYWPNILALSNNTELDVLPFLTMKTEKDLTAFMDSHFSNESNIFTTEVTLEGAGSFKQTYDYVDEYKDLYDYVLGQPQREQRKQTRRKRDDDEFEYRTLRVNNEFFGRVEEETNENIENVIQYLAYDESLENEIL